MSVYMTETEQLEAIKKWWNRHSNMITIMLSVILLIVSGYKYWSWHQEKINQQASNSYEHLMVAFSNQDMRGVRSYAKELVNNYGQTVYADAARLTLAKLYALRENYLKAQEELAYVAMHSKVSPMQQIAKIRLARLLTTTKSYDKALTTLTEVDASIYSPVVNELKGDIYAAIGKYQQAIASYHEAISQVQKNGMGNLFLEMKTNELAAKTQSRKLDNNPQTV